MTFPASLPGTLNIAGSLVGAVGHGTIIHVTDRENIIGLGNKLGLGTTSATPGTNLLLRGIGGTLSGWDQIRAGDHAAGAVSAGSVIAGSVIVRQHIHGTAAIELDKLQTVTASRPIVSNSGGTLQAGTITPSMFSVFTANRPIISDAGGTMVAGTVTAAMFETFTANRPVITDAGGTVKAGTITAAMIATFTASRPIVSDAGGTIGAGTITTSMVAVNAFGVRRLAATTASVNGSALSAAGTFVLMSNQNFVVGDANGVIGIAVRGYAQAFQATAGAVTSRFVLDSAGTPGTYLLGGQRVSVAGESSNPFAGVNLVCLTGLSAGTHTIQVQVVSDNVGTVYMRNGVSGETFGCDIMEWMR